jgi:hypothetical protein
MRGGSDRTGRAPTAEDYSALREKLLATLKVNALEEARLLVKPEQRLLDGMLVVRKVIEENREPPEGQPADRLQLALRVEFEAWAVREADLQAVARAALDANLEKQFQPVPDSLEINFTSPPALDPAGAGELPVQAAGVASSPAEAIAAGSMVAEPPAVVTARWDMQVKRNIEKKWTREDAVRMIQGRGLAEARQLLAAGLSLKEAPQIRIYPGWWGRLPFLPTRIKLVRK